jgi:acyl-coenzyme A thioesterase PaaI-like protein
MEIKGIQDVYPENYNVCFGCGSKNEVGHQIKTVWDGDETVTRFKPEKFHTSIPGYVYGGLLASLIDCHGTGSAALARLKEDGKELGDGLAERFVTGTLTVKYLKPTPIDDELEIRGIIKEIKGRKITIEARLIAKGEICVTGEIIAIQLID